WVTLEVAQGGFATGGFLAGGPLMPNELWLIDHFELNAATTTRLDLHNFFLSEYDLHWLVRPLESDHYDVDVPESSTIYASYFHLPKVLMPAYGMLAAAIAMRSAVFGSNMPNRYVVQNALLIEQVMVLTTHNALALHESS
ncbi:hypothetical protein DYB28_005446, partial [Aphanomyces astaci]